MNNCAMVFSGGAYGDTFNHEGDAGYAFVTYDNGNIDSYLYTYGTNSYGQLGNGTTSFVRDLTRITLSDKRTTSSSAGYTATNTYSKTYDGLEPNGVYNFYVMKSRTEDEPLSAENLYYISQYTADENGMLTINYAPTVNYETADRFVVGMDRMSIEKAVLEISDIIYTGQEQYADVTVSLDDTELTEGIDYELTGDFAATEAGEYTLYVNGIGKYAGKLALSYNVIKEFINQSDIDRDLIIMGDEITITGAAIGGSGTYTYSYYFRNLNDPYWSILETDTDETEMTFEPYKSGKYYIRADVKDSTGTVKKKAMILEVQSANLVNKSVLSAAKIFTGGDITAQGKAEGGTGSYKFAFYYKDVFANKWNKAQGYEPNANVKMTFNKAGLYDICIKAKDSAGTVDKLYFALTVEDETQKPLKNTSVLSKTSIKLGDKVQVTAGAKGGKGSYTYSVYYRKSGTTDWTTALKPGTVNTVEIQPEEQTEYEILAKITDETGKISKKYMTLKVVSPVLSNTSKISSENIYLGQSVTLNGYGKGGTAPYTYAFMYRKEGVENWGIIGTKYGTENKATFTPKAEASYELMINVRDDEGTVKSKTFKINVTEKLDPLENNSTLSADTIALGNTVKITASVSGGKAAYKYAYYFKQSSNETWNAIGTEFGTSAAANFKPTAVTDYDIKVVVKDAKDNTAEKLFKLTVTPPPALENTSTTESVLVVNTALKITGSASGGTAPYTYAYYYKRSVNDKWIAIGTEFTTKTSASFTPKATADYDVKVVVKDSAGTTADKVFAVNVVSSIPLTNDSIISASEVNVNKAVKLTGKASGGTSPYTYAFYYKRSVNTTWKTIGTAYGTATTATLKPTAAASYDIKICVKDSTGKIEEKLFTVTAS